MRLRIATLSVLAFVAVCFAGPLRDALDGGKVISLIAGGLGLSVLGLFGVFSQARKAVEEIMDVVNTVKSLIHKYKNLATGSEVKEDLRKLEKELDEALEACADTIAKLKFPKAKALAKRLRGAL